MKRRKTMSLKTTMKLTINQRWLNGKAYWVTDTIIDFLECWIEYAAHSLYKYLFMQNCLFIFMLISIYVEIYAWYSYCQYNDACHWLFAICFFLCKICMIWLLIWWNGLIIAQVKLILRYNIWYGIWYDMVKNNIWYRSNLINDCSTIIIKWFKFLLFLWVINDTTYF